MALLIIQIKTTFQQNFNNFLQNILQSQMTNQELEPAICKFEEKAYSLEPDMINGWRFKTQDFKQLPIRYVSQPIQRITKQFIKINKINDSRLVYLGPRHTSNLIAIKNYSIRQYDKYSKQSCAYGIPKLLKYQYKYFKQKETSFHFSTNDHRLYTGMNPALEQQEQIIFDSDFQCGNLDLVMKIDSNSYDLFMRVDTNTKGHTSWYFFKVKNKTASGKIVNFNICNFTKKNLLYRNGMKPYVFSKSNQQGWKQAGSNVSYQKKKIRFEVCQNLEKDFYTLSFSYEFQYDYDEVYFAYSIPYSYSFLTNFIRELSVQKNSKFYLKEEYHYESSGGLKIPVLTVTNNLSEKQNKKMIFITGRFHPGQPQSSWMVHGLLKFICSQEAKQIRDHIIFKIIPMVNVDGVVLGNFRTGLKGRDLNRLFKNTQSKKYFEIDYIKQIAEINKSNILMYLDFHGHSNKKNVFIYGPEYRIGEPYYYLSRIIPKMISKATEMFRFYACIFRISSQKQSTARAVMFRQNKIPYCYTIEASTHSYMTNDGEIPFTCQSYIKMGYFIIKEVQKLTLMFAEADIRKQLKRKQRQNRKINKQGRSIQINTNTQKLRDKQKHHSKIKKLKDKKKSLKVVRYTEEEQDDDLGKEFQLMVLELKNDKQKFDIEQEGSSDCESGDEDYTKIQLETFLNRDQKNKKKLKLLDLKNEQIKFLSQKDTLGIRDNQSTLPYITANNQDLLSEGSLPQITYRNSPKKDEQKKYSSVIQKKKNWMNFVNKTKKETLQTRIEFLKKNRQIFAERSKLIKQTYVVNIKIGSDDQELERNRRYSIKQQQPKKKTVLPELQQRTIFDKKKIDILNTHHQTQIPNIVTEIVKNHLRNQQIKYKRLNKSIQIIKL